MVSPLRDYLQDPNGANLPPQLMPVNVGPINRIAWPFHFPVNFNINQALVGANWQYTLQSTFTERRSFQVTADAGFLMTYVYLAGGPPSANLRLQPLMFDMIDVQSSRRMTISPMPINSLGDKAHPFIFEKPMYLEPNSRIDIQLSTFYTGAPVVRTISNNLVNPAMPTMQMVFWGFRVRAADAKKLLSSALT